METRHRLGKEGLFGKPVLILQVRKQFPDGPDDYHGLPTHLAYTAWVDATVEDLGEALKEASDELRVLKHGLARVAEGDKK
jgi:hypothetical protein